MMVGTPSFSKHNLKDLIIHIAGSFVVAYAGYVFFIQTPYFFSRLRLAYGILLWVFLLVALFYLQVRTGSLYSQVNRKFPPGVMSLFLLINLVLVAVVFHIPYTYVLMPLQKVTVTPLSIATEFEIKNFIIENGGYQGINQFQRNENWHSHSDGFIRNAGDEGDLFWVGKPGRYIEINFASCNDCGLVKVVTTGRADEIDLSQANSEGGFQYRIENSAPFLIAHKIFNFILLELAALQLAFILFRVGQLVFRFLPWFRISRNMPNQPNPGAWVEWLPFVWLAFYTVMNYAIKLQPILYNDDWCQIVYSASEKTLQPFMISERRPFQTFIPALFNIFLPIEKTLVASYIAQLTLLVLTAFLTYLLLRNFLDTNKVIALLGASLWLVFPNDYTYTTVILLAVRFAYFLCLVFMLLSLRLARDGEGLSGFAASLVLSFSLLMYEGQLGLALVWPLFLVWRYRGVLTKRRLLGLAFNYLLIGGLVIWKLFLQFTFYEDTKLQSLKTNFADLFIRWYEASRTILGGFRLPYNDGNWLTSENGWYFFLLGLCLIILIWIVAVLQRSTKPPSFAPGFLERSYLPQFVVGGVLWAAGYFPILLNYPANIYSHLSRVNLFSNLGAVIILLALFQMVTFEMNQKRVDFRLNLILTLPLLLVGSLIQLQVQEANNRSWTEAKAFYNQLIQEVPDLREDTQVIVLVTPPDMGHTPRRTLFTSSWEASCAIATLYGTDESNLTVDYRYNDLYVPPFPGFNILGGALNTDTIDSIQDPGKLVVLDYQMPEQKLTILQNVDFLLGENSQGYQPKDRILSTQRLIPFRKLIDP